MEKRNEEAGITGFAEKKTELKVKQSTNVIDNEDIEALIWQQEVQFLDIPDEKEEEEEVAKPNNAEKETVESWKIGVTNEEVAKPNNADQKETVESWKIGVKNKIDEEDAIRRWNVNSSFMKLIISKNPIVDQEGEVAGVKRNPDIQELAVTESEAAKGQKNEDDSKNSKEIGRSSNDESSAESSKNSEEIGGSSSDESSTRSWKNSEDIGGSSSDEYSSTGSS